MKKLPPEEAAIIQRIYTAIVEQPWFNRNAVTERELLKLILHNHGVGYVDEEALAIRCRDEASTRFSGR